MNNCEPCEILLSTWFDGELDRPGQVELLDHLVRCPVCRDFYLEGRGLEGLLGLVRESSSARVPPPEVWQRIESATTTPSNVVPFWRRVPAWGLRAAAMLVLAVGLGVILRTEPFTLAPRPSDAEIGLGQSDAEMTEDRFIELTREVLGADRRYHVAFYEVMGQVMLDTTGEEASPEGRIPRFENDEVADADSPSRNPA